MKTRSSKRPGISTRAPDVSELDFNDDPQPPRTGDPVSPEVLSSELSRRRARRVGLTGAALGEDVTADDLAPETLIDEEGPDSTVRRKLGPADAVLSHLEGEEWFAETPEESTVSIKPRRESGETGG